MNNKIIITGASGFLGSNLLEKIKNDNRYQIYAFSQRQDELKKKIKGDNIEYKKRDDIFDEKIINNSTVINCAFPRNDSGNGYANGLRYIQNVFKFSVHNNANRIINISSQSIYNTQRTYPATEDDIPCLDTPYSIGKFASELLLESSCDNYDLNYTNIRMASLIGPEFEQRIINRLVRQAIESSSIKVDDDNQKFGFLDVEDAVNGLIAIIKNEKGHKWEKVYNMGSAKAYSLKEIAKTIEDVLSEYTHLNVTYIKGNKSYCSAVNSDRFYREFGFCPAIDIRQSVEKIVHYYMRD